uniref:Uncharacterized protein n=1 Tax=Romanomermis culicivorax TaxID=13658 RepID=A0A915HFV5_ROMCU
MYPKTLEKCNSNVINVKRKVLFVVQNNLPISKSSDIHDMPEFFGDISECRVIQHAHHSAFSTYAFIDSMNEAFFQQHIALLRHQKFLTLHIDESTDITEQ